MSKPVPSILDVIARPEFKPWFPDKADWQAWLGFLAALFALPMTPEQLAIYRDCTGRTAPPTTPHREGWLVCGRRSGKSYIMSLIATYLAVFRDWKPFLSPGGRATVMVIARDRDQAGEILNYIKAYFADVPMLRQLLEREGAEVIELNNRVRIQVNSASHTRTRGFAIACAILDEVAFWPVDAGAASPDTEILTAVRNGMGQFREHAVLLCASSPYAKRGVLHAAYQQHYGKDDPVLVWKAPTRTMHPAFLQSTVDEAMERDPQEGMAEYLAEFRSDLSSFVQPEVVDQCTDPVHERLPQRGVGYCAFVDMSGGSQDSAALAISHCEGKDVVLDLVHEVPAPHSPNAAVAQFVPILRRFQCWSVTGDGYAGEWPRASFQEHGVGYDLAERNKSEIYTAFLPLLNSHAVRLIEHSRMRHQLVSLERSTRSGGKDKIDHPRYGRDDVINAAAGACIMANDYGAVLPSHRQAYAINAHDPLATPEENEMAMARAEARSVGRFSGPGWAPTWHGRDDEQQQAYAVE